MRRPVIIGGILGLIGVLGFLVAPLPSWVDHPVAGEPLRILDRRGNLLYEERGASAGTRSPVALKDIPQDVINALIAAEDKTFRSHPGLSLRGIVRAAWLNVRGMQIVAGGSTITQQMVRASRGRYPRTIPGKLMEMAWALKIDTWMSKDAILEKHLSAAYFGHRAYGIGAAAKTFFGTAPQELSLAESAFLVGLLQAPSAYDPFANFAVAKKRQEYVLRSMVDAGFITNERAEEALKEKLSLADDRIAIEAPHFVHWVLSSRADLLPESGDVRTTLDFDLQREAQRAVDIQVERLADHNVTSAAVVVLDARTGDVLTMIGSADYFDDEHDGAVNVAIASRQPGSALKPFTYALALAKGDSPATTVADVSSQFFTQEGNPYTPRNYDFDEHGLVRYRESLANSYNIAAVKVLERVGVEPLLDELRSAGITTLTQPAEHYGLALTLGSGEVRLLELAAAYGIFPRQGRTLTPRALPTEPVKAGRSVLDPKIAWLISDILSDDSARLAEFGEDGPLSFDSPVAAKTGTTRNSRDNWVVGYTNNYIVGVWVGNADNTPMRGTSGVTGAGPIFHEVMAAVLMNDDHADFPRPAGITEHEICALSGKLPSPACPHTVREWFVNGTEPTQPDDLYRVVRIDKRNGLLAGEGCPRAFVDEKIFAVLPAELRDWAQRTAWPSPPSRSSPLCAGASSAGEKPWVLIANPPDGQSIRLDPLLPDEYERLSLRASAAEGIDVIEWFVNGQSVGIGRAPDFAASWKPQPGTFRIEARATDAHDERVVTVVR